MHASFVYVGVIAFTLGIFIRSFFAVGLPAIAAAVMLAFVLACLWQRNRGAVSDPAVLYAALAILFMSFGVLRMEIADWNEIIPAFESRVGSEVSVEGTIVREPDVRSATTHLYIETDVGRILVITDAFGDHAYGEQVAVTGELAKPESFETDLGRTFNYPGYLQARGVSYMMIYPQVERLNGWDGNWLMHGLLVWKHSFMDNIESLIPEPMVGLGEGLLLGEKRALGEELELVFRRTGIIHIVVLSGYNVMLVVAFVLFCLSFLFGLRARMVVGIIAVALFALLVGLSPTVLRASIMAGLLLVAQGFGETYDVLRALCIAGAAMLFVNPYLLVFDPGFQLSFLATLGLIMVAPQLEARLALVPRTIGVREFLVATLATQLIVWPLLLYQIGEFSVVSVVVNVLVLPMVPLAMLLTFCTGVVAALSSVAAMPFAFLAYLSLLYILEVAGWFATLPFAAFVVPAFPFSLMVGAYVVMGVGIWYVSRRQSIRADLSDV
ncbi:MAG: ComEC/Rec2 family competence protein [Candidatus Paceibacterota bacterium]